MFKHCIFDFSFRNPIVEITDTDKKRMPDTTNKPGTTQWLHLLFAAVLVVTYFLPWVSWDAITVNGSAMANGSFFTASEAVGGPGNPFSKLSFSFYLFWIIPVLAALSVVLVLLKRKATPFSYIAGAAALALITIFYLFTNTIIDLGIGENVFAMLKPAAYIHIVSAIGLIITALPIKSVLPKFFWLLIGPVIAYAGYKMGEKYIMSETHTATEDVKADFTVNAANLIKEFTVNDTATNKKYIDKMLVVNGNVSVVEIQQDSTSTIRFADSTGSYAIFSLEKNLLDKVKTIKQGDAVSLKAVCSGSIFSEILGTTAITFKRATFNSTK
jgi:tRNA_anti-like